MKYFSDYILLTILIIVGLTGAIGARSLTIIEGSLPGAGFFPLVLGFFLAVLCVIQFRDLRLKSSLEDKEVDIVQVKRLLLFVSLLIIAVIIGSPLIGLLPSLGIFLLVSLIAWNRLMIKVAVVNTLIILAIIYLMFSVWLRVHMPWGLLGG